MNTAPNANPETEFEFLLAAALPADPKEVESAQERDRDIELELLFAAALFFELDLRSRGPYEAAEPPASSSAPDVHASDAHPAAQDHPHEQGDVCDSVARLVPIYRLEFEREYAESLDRVWLALSSEAEVSQWMKYPVKLELQIGGTIRVDFTPDEPLEGIICALRAPEYLAYLWGDSFVRWQLDGGVHATRLRLSHIGVRPELVVALGAGWHAFLDQLEDHFTGASRPDRYVDLTERYVAELRPQLTRRT